MSEGLIIIGKTVQELAPEYFRNPKSYFWRWVEKGKIVEWCTGNTLCYREELARVLRSLTGQGLPPLASVLLLLAACADTWADACEESQALDHVASQLPPGADDPTETALDWQLRHARLFMDVVRGLPASLRTGEPKLHLFREVFSVQAPQVSIELAGALLDEWDSGRSDTVLHFSRDQVARRVFSNELVVLAQAYNRFPTTDALELLLRTGLAQLPPPLPLPAAPLAERSPEPPTDLLEQLAQDARTAGLARLSQQLGAVLRVPLHLRGAGEQPLGGVADLSNRGDFDRLLLSELAHDDLSLLARLANNEALYLRREQPPRPEMRPRTILLDTTLRLWGVPRVFALAAALAWARLAPAGRASAPPEAWALGGHDRTALHLDTVAGVVAALGALDPALHAGEALTDFARLPARADVLLITEAQQLTQPDFARALAEAAPALRYLLTVDRNGELALFEYLNGQRRPVATSRHDLDALLFGPGAEPRRERRPQPEFLPGSPAFLQCVPAPLFLPTVGLRGVLNAFSAGALGVMAVTDTRRVLHWPDRRWGARELLAEVEDGSYCFGSDEQQWLYLLVHGRQRLLVYGFEVATGQINVADLAAELGPQEAPGRAAFEAGCFLVQLAVGTLAFDCASWAVRERRTLPLPPASSSGFRPDFGPLKRHVNNGYNVLQRVNSLGVNGRGELAVNGRHLSIVSSNADITTELHWQSTPPQPESARSRLATPDEQPLKLTPNPQVLFRRFSWADGSVALVDTRGLLHLRSGNPTLPEITLLLVLNQPTAAWASDGTVGGSAYFTGPEPDHPLPVAEFYQLYLQPFIDHLA